MSAPASENGEALRQRLDKEAKASGYCLNPDSEMTSLICAGLAKNQARYGYPSCPCRLASGKRQDDRDIICPCDYRDADLAEFGACYCALYVSAAIASGAKKAAPVPERRPAPDKRAASTAPKPSVGVKVWRCRVCGYLCARENPPDKCPVCKADKDRFELFPL